MGAALAVLFAWPVLGDPTGLAIGHPVSASLDHLWGLWATAEGLWQHGPLLRDVPDVGFPEGFRALQYEAANLLLFLPGYWLGGGGPSGAVLGWNVLHVGMIVVGVVGCWRLARDLVGPEPSAALLVAVFVGCPFLVGQPHMGHTEYLPVVLWPWHLWALRRWLGGGRLAWAVLSAFTLVAMAATASYLGVFLALLEVPLGVGLAWKRRAWWRLVLVAAVALPVVGAFVWWMAQPWPTGHGTFAGQSVVSRPGVAMGDLLAGFSRWSSSHPVNSQNEQVAYPGLVAVVLAVIGAVFRRAARWWIALAVFAFALSLGVAVLVGETRYLLPAGMLEQAIPSLSMVHWWERIAPLAALPLGVSAVYGALILGRRLRQPSLVALVLALAVVADQATWPRRGVLPPPVVRVSPPVELLDVLLRVPEGALIQFPLPLINLSGPPVSTGRYLVWQQTHGRPISTRQTLLSDSTLEHSYLTRLVANRQASLGRRGLRQIVLGTGPLDATAIECSRADAARLHEQGFAAVVLYMKVGRALPILELLESVLGDPIAQDEVRVWPLDGVPKGGKRCALPVPARPVASLLRL